MTMQMEVNRRYSPSDWLKIQRTEFDKEKNIALYLKYGKEIYAKAADETPESRCRTPEPKKARSGSLAPSSLAQTPPRTPSLSLAPPRTQSVPTLRPESAAKVSSRSSHGSSGHYAVPRAIAEPPRPLSVCGSQPSGGGPSPSGGSSPLGTRRSFFSSQGSNVFTGCRRTGFSLR
eukprot:TRINITY_DN71982_c0_g1_i1.p1 TRINITY_DN71982_c0_g1~~TRINITY_DN71982_c0_g1_i1.p1  ORF type:complete len:175 (+),score=37.47 TRINITY_DN71982_c0_g1_i1:81-605(+)